MGVIGLAALLAGPAVAEQARATFTVSAVVPAVVTLTTLEQPSLLSLSVEDVERGYKDVSARYQVRHNDTRGYLLRLTPRVGVTRHVEVLGFAAPILLQDADVEIRRSSTPRLQDLTLEFRFVLDSKVQPGAYALPVLVSAIPL